MRKVSMAKPWWTVSAVYADTDEGYVTHVQADDAAGARAKAYREAESVITVASVFAGKLTAEAEPTSDVTPLRGRGHAIAVSHVLVTERKIMLPSKCPKCRSDLRKPHAVTQGDLVFRKWTGHLTKTGDSVSGERDQQENSSRGTLIEAAKIRCSMCSSDLWNGVVQEGS